MAKKNFNPFKKKKDIKKESKNTTKKVVKKDSKKSVKKVIEKPKPVVEVKQKIGNKRLKRVERFRK